MRRLKETEHEKIITLKQNSLTLWRHKIYTEAKQNESL